MPRPSKSAAPHLTATERKLRNYQLLARVSNAINSSLDPKEVLNLVLTEAVRIMHATSGSICLIDPHTQMLEIEVSTGLSRQARDLRLAIGRGVTGWVAKTGQSLRVPDVTIDPRYVSVRRSVRSELAVPLIVESTLIGVLNVDSTRRDAFSTEDQQLLEALANHAAKVIHNAWLYEAVAYNARKLESLFTVAQSIISSHDLPDILRRVTREACQLMETKVCSLMLLNAAGTHLELKACHGAGPEYLRKPPLQVDNSLLGVVIVHRKPLRVHNVQAHDAFRYIELARKEGLVSLLAVPMVVGQTVIGALNVYTSRPYRFSTQDINVLSALANLAAVAIENARLHEKLVAVEEQLRSSERLSTLGLLAAEVAHEIRNPLTSMKMLFHSLQLAFPADDPRQRDAEVVAEKMDHLNQIVDSLLGYARSTEPQLAPVNLNDLLEDVLLLTRPKLRHQGVDLVRDFANQLPLLRADRGQIEQTCLNLVLNAVEAMPAGGTLTITTRLESPAMVRLEFRDTGIGMTAEQQSQIFQPFLTSKPHGTGLGLAIVQKTIEAHRGKVEVESRPQHGTVFRLLLPAG